MALTVSNIERTMLSTKRMNLAQIAFDSSYAYGGEALTPSNLSLTAIDQVTINPIKGYSFEYDYTNEKLKVFKDAPPIVYEEIHTIASNAITLDYPAAAILQISSATQSQMLVEASDTPAANECNLAAAMAAGVRPTINFHASTSGAIKVTYITQAWKEVWDNRVAAADFATTTHVADLDDTICFIESILTLDTSAAVVSSFSMFVRGGDAATAGECEVDWTDSGAATASDTTLTFAAADAVTDIKLTYIKLPTSGFLKNRFLEDEDLTIGSNVGASKYPILFQGVCNQLPDYTAANERDAHHLMMAEGDALGTGQECRIDWHLTKTLAGNQVALEDSSSDAVSLTYVYGVAHEIPNLVPLELVDGEDLSVLTGVRVQVIGR